MPYFAYTARDARGQLLQGVLESADPGGAAAQLFARGVTPVDIAAHEPPRTIQGFAGATRERIRPIDLMLFSRQMYTLLKAGVPIMRALAGLQESSTNATFGAVLGEVRQHLESGNDFATSLAHVPRVFSHFFVSMVRVGEMTGRLEEIFLALFHHLEFEQFMREQVKAAIRYPCFVLATMAAALVVVNLFVIPAFAKVYEGMNARLPFMTEVLIGFSRAMVTGWPYLLAGGIAGTLLLRAWRRTPAGKATWDRVKVELPIAGRIVLQATLARFARSLALALRSGVPVAQALLTVAQTVDNDHVGRAIEKMRDGLERGESVLHTAVAAGVFTPVVLQMIAVGEESGALDDLMQEVADMYQREVQYELKALSSQLEPVLIVCLAALVLVLALGVFLPIWDLGRAVMHG